MASTISSVSGVSLLDEGINSFVVALAHLELGARGVELVVGRHVLHEVVVHLCHDCGVCSRNEESSGERFHF